MAKYTDGPQWYAFPYSPNLSGGLIPDGVTPLLLGDLVDEAAIVVDDRFTEDYEAGQGGVLVLVQMSEEWLDLELTECNRVNEELDAIMDRSVEELLQQAERADEFLAPVDEQGDMTADPDPEAGT